MHNATQSLIAPTANAALERALRDKLQRRGETIGSLGELEPLAVRIGLIQDTLRPRFEEPQVVLFAGDNGLAVEGLPAPPGQTTAERVWQVLSGQLPLSVFAGTQGLAVSVVDAGVADRLHAHERLLMRKIAHGTRNARVGPAMSLDQAQAAIRAGMEIAQSLPGNVLACAGLGVGSHESAALILSRLTGAPVRELLLAHPQMEPNLLIIKIAPDEGISLRFGAKLPGPEMHLRQVQMNFGYAEAFHTEPETAYDLLMRGQALLERRHFAQAAIVLERADRQEPAKGSILEALGRAYFNSGQTERARATFEALLEVEPSSHYAHYAIGQSLKRLGRNHRARPLHHARKRIDRGTAVRNSHGDARAIGNCASVGYSSDSASEPFCDSF